MIYYIDGKKTSFDDDVKREPIKIAGFRIIDIEPNENESLGFDICMGPTNTFIMISYVEPDSTVAKYGMKVGDELVSVNDASFKMMELEQAIEILSTEATLRLVLQTSGFLPEPDLSRGNEKAAASSSPSLNVNELEEKQKMFCNEWVDAFDRVTTAPAESKASLNKHVRRIVLRPSMDATGLGIRVRGGIEYGLGVFISQIEPNSVADLNGLKVCDQIIDVNGQKFSRISHKDAVLILETSLASYRSSRVPIKITVRYLSKLPVLKSTSSTINDCDTKIGGVVVSQVAALKRIEEEALFRDLLKTASSFTLFKYYMSQYLNGHVNFRYLLYLILKRLKNVDTNVSFYLYRFTSFNTTCGFNRTFLHYHL